MCTWTATAFAHRRLVVTMSTETRTVSDLEFIYVAGAAGLGTRPTVARDEFRATLAKIKADAWDEGLVYAQRNAGARCADSPHRIEEKA